MSFNQPVQFAVIKSSLIIRLNDGEITIESSSTAKLMKNYYLGDERFQRKKGYPSSIAIYSLKTNGEDRNIFVRLSFILSVTHNGIPFHNDNRYQ